MHNSHCKKNNIRSFNFPLKTIRTIFWCRVWCTHSPLSCFQCGFTMNLKPDIMPMNRFRVFVKPTCREKLLKSQNESKKNVCQFGTFQFSNSYTEACFITTCYTWSNICLKSQRHVCHTVNQWRIFPMFSVLFFYICNQRHFDICKALSFFLLFSLHIAQFIWSLDFIRPPSLNFAKILTFLSSS